MPCEAFMKRSMVLRNATNLHERSLLLPWKYKKQQIQTICFTGLTITTTRGY